jgi:hypothetical protein
MSAKENEAIARRYAELFVAGDLDALAEEPKIGMHRSTRDSILLTVEGVSLPVPLGGSEKDKSTTHV